MTRSQAQNDDSDCNVVNFTYDEHKQDIFLTVLVNRVRFHISAEKRRLQAQSGPGKKLADEYQDLLAAIKAAENDFTKPCSLGNLRTRKGSKDSDSQDSGYHTKGGSPASSDNDHASNEKSDKEKSSSFEEAASDPYEAVREWMLQPLKPVFTKKAPSTDNKEQSVQAWYSGTTFFYSLSLDDAGSLKAMEEKATPELEGLVAGTLPKMYVPKWIRQLDIPWYPAIDVKVLRESDEIPPFHPSQVRIGEDTYFLKMVDPTQPQPTRREIDYLNRIEKAGLHEKFRVPLIKGLIGFENSKTEMMGFILTEIEDPTPLTHLLDEEVPQEKRDAWAKESKRIVSLLHEHQMVWGDAKGDNFMVDKHDNLWIIDFGGSYTDGWIDPELMETEAGDNMGVERVVNALHNPTENTFDPNQSTLSATHAEAGAGNKRKVGKLDEESVLKEDQADDQSDNEGPPRKRARRQDPGKSNKKEDDAEAAKDDEQVDSGSVGRGGDSEAEDDPDDDELTEDIGDEERYCVCEKPSSGDMIACDNESCAHQWFHFECVGLQKAPAKSKQWFCDECKSG